LIALDPTLVQQAAVTHYKTAGFDSNQYLDKLLTLESISGHWLVHGFWN